MLKNGISIFGIVIPVLALMISCSSAQQPAPVDKAPVPPAPDPSPNKVRLLNFLADEYGKRMISGQMDTSWTNNNEMDMITRVYTDTGKYPALKGFDLIQLPMDFAPFLGGEQQINEAIEWWEGKNNGRALLPDKPEIHGIVSFCWHWRAGEKMEFYTSNTNFLIPWKNGRLDTESKAFKEILQDLDSAASLFKILKERDIPVLWRPLHEASGGWFWWGARGSRAYIALWEFMHEYFTNIKGLNNLIWVWNGDNVFWLPNPDTIDIVSRDLYTQNYTSLRTEFRNTVSMTPGREFIIALSENDKIPDPDECIKNEALWSWFMTWNDRKGSVQGETHKDNFWTGEYHNPQSHKVKVYNHPAVITLDKLPDLTKYRLD